jgi:tetratricopeptide (TPR) repeat protein
MADEEIESRTAALEQRLQEFSRTRDAELITDPDLLRRVRPIARKYLSEPKKHPREITMLAWLYYHRCGVLPPSERRLDQTVVILLTEALRPDETQGLPAQMIQLIDESKPTTPLQRAQAAAELGEAYRTILRGDLLDYTAAAMRDALAALGSSSDTGSPQISRKVELMGLLAATLQMSARSGYVEDLDEAIDLKRKILSLDPNAAGDPVTLYDFASMLMGRFEIHGRPADLDEAMIIARRAVAAAGERDDFVDYLCQLARILKDQYLMTAEPRHVREGVDLLRTALTFVNRVPGPSSQQMDESSVQGLLSSLLIDEFDRTGRPGALDDAIAAARRSLALRPPEPVNPRESSQRSDDLSLLGNELRIRYELLGARADLDEAIDLGSESVRDGTDRPARQSARFINLALSLYERARLTASLDELDDAIRWARAAAVSAVEYRDAALCLSNIAAMLEVRSRLSDTPERDLEESVQAARESVGALPEGHSERVLNVRNLGALLYRMFLRLGTAVLLQEAISLTREAIASTAYPAEQCPGQHNLGVMLMANFQLTQDATCFTEAMEAWATAAATTAGDPRSRIDAASARASIAQDHGLGDQASAAYAQAIELLAVAVWHGLTADDRRLRLVEYSGLARGAAAAWLSVDASGRRAVELLDQGRNVVWAQILDQRRDLAELANVRPDLAAALDAVRRELDQHGVGRSSVEIGVPPAREPN